MATLKQIAANRANAQKSTGPKTPEGKSRSSRNAFKHALTSTRTLVGNEDPLEYHELRAALLRDYAPANTQEMLLVDRIASAAWRTLRARQMEQTLSNMSIEQFQAKRKHPHPRNAGTDTEALTLSLVEDDLWRLMHRYDTQISRDFFKSIEALRKLQNDRLRQARQIEHDVRRDSSEARQDEKIALRRGREQRQSKQIKETANPKWVPFEIALPANAATQGDIQVSGSPAQTAATKTLKREIR